MIEEKAMYKISYGLYLLTSKDKNGRDNGSIINTAVMLTDTPKRITVNVNRETYTNEILKKNGVFNLSVLTESAPFELFKRFGYQSGKTTDKFEGLQSVASAENGLLYLTEHANAVISAKVIDGIDYGTHTLFVAEVTDAKVLSDAPSATYGYYFARVKPKDKIPQGKKGYICKICGYIYEGEPLPEDFICPVCKYPASYFVKL